MLHPTTIRRSLHRPRSAAPLLLRGRLGASLPARPCLHPRTQIARRHRFLIEAVAAGMATVLLTGVAMAFPAVLRQSPITTAQHLAGVIVPSLAPPDPSGLIDCP